MSEQPTSNTGPPDRPRLQEFPETSPDRPEDPTGYKPLSLLALAGFGVAVAYGLFLLVFLLFALGGNSLLMDQTGFTLLWPLGALVLSLLGWLQVRRSEGTRAGGGFASWGIILSVLFGLAYWASLFATSVGVSQQAEPKIVEMFELLKQDQPSKAFLLTVPPEIRPNPQGKSPEAFRDEVEIRFGVPEAGRAGRMVEFCRSELAKRLAAAGQDPTVPEGQRVQVVSQGVREWKYEKNGYVVRHMYKVTTPEAEFDVLVSAYGTDPKDGSGRVWAVRWEGESALLKETMKKTPHGEKLEMAYSAAYTLATAWAKALRAGSPVEAYLLTIDPAERTKPRGFFGFLELVWTPENRAFREGALVQDDPARFWAPGALRKEVPAAVKKLFAQPDLFAIPSPPVPDKPFAGLEVKSPPYRWSVVGDRLRMVCDADLTYQTHQAGAPMAAPKYLIDAAVVVEGPASALDTPSKDLNAWRVVGLDLRRAHLGPTAGSVSGPTPPQPQPPPPVP